MFTSAIDRKVAQRQRQSPGTNGLHLEDKRTQFVQRKAVSHDGQTIQKKEVNTASVVQLEKKKRAKYTVGGGVGLGLVGAGIGSLIPGVGTLAGGLVGAVIGGIGGYLYSKPKIYSNLQKGDYENELEGLRVHQHEFRNSNSEYEKGTIVKYSSTNAKKFMRLLGLGSVLYTYDKNNQLSIGSGVGPMKHALVAGNEDVKAAGWAKPQQSKQQLNQQLYKYYIDKLEFFAQQKRNTERQALLILKKYDLPINNYSEIPDDGEKEIVGQYKTAVEHLELYGPQAEELEKQDREQPGVTKKTQIQLDNESGHYHPGADTKDEAFEGWRNAGFTNLTWKAWKKKTN